MDGATMPCLQSSKVLGVAFADAITLLLRGASLGKTDIVVSCCL